MRDEQNGPDSGKDPDEHAWNAMVGWSRTGSTPVFDGIDISETSRSFLWDKVSRSIRSKIDPDRMAFETEIEHSCSSTGRLDKALNQGPVKWIPRPAISL